VRYHLIAALVFAAVSAASSFNAPLLAQDAAPQTKAKTRLDDIIGRGKLRIGATGDYRPFTYLNKETGKFEGHDIDVALALGKAMGVEVEFVQTSWPTLSKDFAADMFDIAMGGVSITLARQLIGSFSTPIMREGKAPIARCGETEKFDTITEIDAPNVRVVVNPGGTNEKFARAHFKESDLRVHGDNVTIFKEIAEGRADVMVTDASETKFQQKLHPGVLCAVNPDKPFDFAEKGYWIQRDPALKEFVDQWLHIANQTGEMKAIYARWFE
jgi:cyclohexadienyl dehydratase